MFARAQVEVLFFGGGLEGLAIPVGGVLWVCGVMVNARLHGAVEGAREYFSLRLECELDGPL